MEDTGSGKNGGMLNSVRMYTVVLAVLWTLSGCTDPLPDGLPDSAEILSGCSLCHGNAGNAAPPVSLSDGSAVTDIAVGAHQVHMTGGTVRSSIPCESCHVVPRTVDQPGHRDTSPAEITWSALAKTGGLNPVWNRVTGTCSSVYCHGASLTGGTLTQPAWTSNDPAQTACGACHGNPPPPPHAATGQCRLCHPETVNESGGIDLAGAKHINGTVESLGYPHPDGWAEPSAHGYAFFDEPDTCRACHGDSLAGGSSGVSCNSCHTGGASWRTDCLYCHGGLDTNHGAPPYGLRGETSVTSLAVGAHTAHLTASPSHEAWSCSVCHVVPGSFDDPGHMDTVAGADVDFSSPAGVSAAYSHATGMCSSLYCHGNGRSVSGTVSWTSTAALGCQSCHRNSTLGGRHGDHLEEGVTCYTCHKTVVSVNGSSITNKTLHVNGSATVSLTEGTYSSASKTCSTSCHERTVSW